ncbi:30S ribosomal protein S18 [Patescibacteria group bacterium]|nr:30S ribosomal protein S18 [Patescibacteria group bacterium]
MKPSLNKDKGCYFCINGIKEVNYTDGQLLRKFISSYAKIMPPRRSKLCSKHQRKLATAIKRARFMAILPYLNR